jgi:hypothetical protein
MSEETGMTAGARVRVPEEQLEAVLPGPRARATGQKEWARVLSLLRGVSPGVLADDQARRLLAAYWSDIWVVPTLVGESAIPVTVLRARVPYLTFDEINALRRRSVAELEALLGDPVVCAHLARQATEHVTGGGRHWEALTEILAIAAPLPAARCAWRACAIRNWSRCRDLLTSRPTAFARVCTREDAERMLSARSGHDGWVSELWAERGRAAGLEVVAQLRDAGGADDPDVPDEWDPALVARVRALVAARGGPLVTTAASAVPGVLCGDSEQAWRHVEENAPGAVPGAAEGLAAWCARLEALRHRDARGLPDTFANLDAQAAVSHLRSCWARAVVESHFCRYPEWDTADLTLQAEAKALRAEASAAAHRSDAGAHGTGARPRGHIR